MDLKNISNLTIDGKLTPDIIMTIVSFVGLIDVWKLYGEKINNIFLETKFTDKQVKKICSKYLSINWNWQELNEEEICILNQMSMRIKPPITMAEHKQIREN